MSRFVKAEMDGSLKINVESKVFEKVKKSSPWFLNRHLGQCIMIGLAISDLAGFFQLAEATLGVNLYLRAIIMVDFTAAFELAPIYIGYAISLKCYKLGKKIRKKIFWLSLIAFLIGIFANGIFRVMTMDIAYVQTNADGSTIVNNVALPATILLTVLPILTSLVNIVIGCLAFDPLYFDLVRIKKRLNILQEKKRQLLVCISEIDHDDVLKEEALKNIEMEYTDALDKLNIAKSRFINYTQIICPIEK